MMAQALPKPAPATGRTRIFRDEREEIMNCGTDFGALLARDELPRYCLARSGEINNRFRRCFKFCMTKFKDNGPA